LIIQHHELLTSLNDYLWTYLLIGCLICCGVYFTWKTRFVQFRMFGEMFRLLGDSTVRDKEGRHISSFQAFAVSVATRVGSGNLAGVATAIVIGGPGAVFWMWVMALFGAATSFVESTLAQLFKQKHKDSYIGGPAYYINKGLHKRWMANLFAILISVAFGMAQTSIQSNTIAGAMQEAFHIPPAVTGIVLAFFALLIVFGGIQRIARVSSVLVPVMALGYLALTLVVIALNIRMVPEVFRLIIADAFGFTPALGGTVGTAIMIGVRRGLFSNEAGEGSSPNVAATATVSHPVKQGLVQSLGVFTDTLLVCSCTAFIIIISGLYDTGVNGIALTQNALQSEIGRTGPVFVALAILLFAFSSIIGNYYYGEANIRFLTRNGKVLTVFRILAGGVFVVIGAVISMDAAWSLGDFFMALVTLCNLIAIVLLGKYAFRLLDDYRAQRRRGVRDPVFHKDTMPDLDLDAWD